MIITEQEFKRKQILVIKNEQGRIFFSAGLNKCKLLLEHIEAIKEFIAKNSESKKTGPINNSPEPQGNDIISNGI